MSSRNRLRRERNRWTARAGGIVNPEILVRAVAVQEPNLERLAQARATSVATLKRELNRHVARLVRPAELFIRLRGRSVRGLLDAGRVLSRVGGDETTHLREAGVETNSEATFRRGVMERFLFSGASGPIIYGYLSADPDGGFSTANLCPYGTVAVKLSPRLRSRATFTLGAWYIGDEVCPAPLVAPHLYAADYTNGDPVSDLASVDDWGRGDPWDRFLRGESNDWAQREAPFLRGESNVPPERGELVMREMTSVEAQLQGGVNVADIAELIFLLPPGAEMTAALDRSGVSWRVKASDPPVGHRNVSLRQAIPNLESLISEVMSRSRSASSEVHGVSHWQSVARIGYELSARMPEVNPAVVFLFALLHDSMRLSDGHDPLHGTRAGVVARMLAVNGLIRLPATDLELLIETCRLHSDGQVTRDPTMGVCWDADRLNLWRLGPFPPNPNLLSTPAARDPERIKWACMLSIWDADRSWQDIFEAYCALP